MSDFIVLHGRCGEVKAIRKEEIRVLEDEPVMDEDSDPKSIVILTLNDGVQISVKGRAEEILKKLETTSKEK